MTGGHSGLLKRIGIAKPGIRGRSLPAFDPEMHVEGRHNRGSNSTSPVYKLQDRQSKEANYQ
jgi:hypothetical protein